MSSISNTDNNLNMNINKIHCISFSCSDLSIMNDYTHSTFHSNSDIKNIHKLNFDFHIACF